MKISDRKKTNTEILLGDSLVYQLEGCMMPWEEFQKKAPKKLVDMASDIGVAGGGYTEETGWFVVAGGQGPCIIHMDKDPGNVQNK
jgi:hypothetical protein